MMPSMLLVSLYEFRQFLQIVLWIAVPATIIAVGLTILFHYRRKKRHASLELAFDDDQAWSETLVHNPASAVMIHSTVNEQPDAVPDWLASGNPDNTSLLKKYEHEVRRYRENYAVLEQDFRDLEGRYADLRNKAYQTDKEEDRTLVAQLQKDIKAYQEKIRQLQEAVAENNTAAIENAVAETNEKIRQLQQDLLQYREENDRLQRLVVAGNAAEGQTDDERVQSLLQLLHNTEAEHKVLKHKLAEQEYLPDILEEKRTQIEFLQQQLEQRIKSYRQLEHQANESAARLQQLQQSAQAFEQKITQLTNELETQRQQSAAAYDQRVKELTNELEVQRQQSAAAYDQRVKELTNGLEVQRQQSAAAYDQRVKELTNELEALRQQSVQAYEQRVTQLTSELETKHQQLAQAFEQQIAQLTNELETERQQSAQWQSALEERRVEEQQKRELIAANAIQIDELEKTVRVLQETQARLQAEVEGQQTTVSVLRSNLAQEQEKSHALEARLEQSSQLLMRIYGELTRSIDSHRLDNILIDPATPTAVDEVLPAAARQLQASL